MRNIKIFGDLGHLNGGWLDPGLSPLTPFDPPLLRVHKISEYFVTTTFNKRVSSEKGQQQHVVYGTYTVVYLLC